MAEISWDHLIWFSVNHKSFSHALHFSLMSTSLCFPIVTLNKMTYKENSSKDLVAFWRFIQQHISILSLCKFSDIAKWKPKCLKSITTFFFRALECLVQNSQFEGQTFLSCLYLVNKYLLNHEIASLSKHVKTVVQDINFVLWLCPGKVHRFYYTAKIT